MRKKCTGDAPRPSRGRPKTYNEIWVCGPKTKDQIQKFGSVAEAAKFLEVTKAQVYLFLATSLKGHTIVAK